MSSTLQDPIVTPSGEREARAPSTTRWVTAGLLLAGLAVAVVIVRMITATPATTPVDTAAVVAALTDFAIDLGVETLEAGATVTLDVVNDGQLPHDLAIVDGPATPILGAGEDATLTYQVGDAGSVRMVCTVPGHEAAGMFLTVPVAPPVS